jgi:hypothetical protein
MSESLLLLRGKQSNSHTFGLPITALSPHFHILIIPLLRIARRNRKTLHGEFCRVLIDHQLDIAILSAVGAESCKCIAKRGLEL